MSWDLLCWLWFHSISNGVTAGTKAVRRFPFSEVASCSAGTSGFQETAGGRPQDHGKRELRPMSNLRHVSGGLAEGTREKCGCGLYGNCQGLVTCTFCISQDSTHCMQRIQRGRATSAHCKCGRDFSDPKGLFFGIYKFKFYSTDFFQFSRVFV